MNEAYELWLEVHYEMILNCLASRGDHPRNLEEGHQLQADAGKIFDECLLAVRGNRSVRSKMTIEDARLVTVGVLRRCLAIMGEKE